MIQVKKTEIKSLSPILLSYFLRIALSKIAKPIKDKALANIFATSIDTRHHSLSSQK